jgi:ABC-type long-subunit fatty acid transport system fused permease/ATPase subunit
MNQLRHLIITLGVVISLFLIFSQMVYASIDVGTSGRTACSYYIDAGTGSIIIQFLIGSFVGLIALAGVYRTRVKNFLTNLFTRRRQDKESGKDKESEESE